MTPQHLCCSFTLHHFIRFSYSRRHSSNERQQQHANSAQFQISKMRMEVHSGYIYI